MRALVVVGITGLLIACYGSPETAESGTTPRPARRAVTPGPAPGPVGPGTPARSTEPPATLRTFYTAERGGKSVGAASLTYEKNDEGYKLELRQSLDVGWGNVTHNVTLQTDDRFVPKSMTAIEMDQEAKTILRIFTQYDVAVEAAAVTVTTQRFNRRWKHSYAVQGGIPLVRYPLLAAYLLARRFKSDDAGVQKLAGIDHVSGQTVEITVTGTVAQGEVALEIALGAADKIKVKYGTVSGKLSDYAAEGKGTSYKSGGKPPSVIPPPVSSKPVVDVAVFSWPAALKTIPFEVKVPGGVTVNGTLSMPAREGRAPVIVILPRASSTDQDGTVGQRKLYAELAAFLNGAGYAVLRLTPRWAGGSANAAKANLATLSSDLKDVIASLRKQPQINPKLIYLLGHAEGGLVAAAYATARGGDLRGLILVSTPGVRYADYVVEQYKRRWEMTGMAVPDVESRTAWFKQQVDKVGAGTLKEFLGRPGALMQDLLKLDVQTAFRRLRIPALLLAGTADVTVREADVSAFKVALYANKKVTVVQPPSVGHVLQEAYGNMETSEEWKDPAPFAATAGKAITDWLQATSK